MKLLLVALFCLAMMSCKETPKEMKTETATKEMAAKVDDSKYPEALRKVFEAHGGLNAWKSKRVLSFEIPKEKITEKQTIDLYSRDEKIEMPGISMGSNGADIWLHDEKEAYKGNAVFYHNLMFYFYTMPFVLADDGINYSETEAIEFEGISYPGIRISYDDGVGLSSKDEYFIHYNPETFQMEWLGYTVTFRTGEKSEKVNWIRYNDWMTISDVVLSKSLTWFVFEDEKLKEPRSTRNFENIALSETAKPADFFMQPEGAKIMNGKME